MRTVFSNREIPHLWAHKTQFYARNAKGSLYFERDTIYSYGNHFPIARHITNDKGAACVFVNPGSYGVTTSNHQSMVRASLPASVPCFYVDPDITPTRALPEYAKRVNEAVGKMVRARSSAEWRHRTAIEIRTEALAFCAFFDLDASTVPEVPDLTPEALAVYKAREAERNKVKRAEQIERERIAKIERERKEAERAVMLEEWRTHRRAEWNGSFLYNGPIALRLSPNRSEVETSRGVRVPVDAAKLALEVVREVKASGVPWSSPPSERVAIGSFSLDKVESDGTLHAGCHVIAFAEIERFCASVGW